MNNEVPFLKYNAIVWDGSNLDDCIAFYDKAFQLIYDCDRYGKNEGGKGLIVPVKEEPDSNCYEMVVLKVGGYILKDKFGYVCTIQPELVQI